MPAKGKSPLTRKRKAQIIAFTALAETQTEAARLAGVAKSTVTSVLKQAEIDPELREQSERVKKTLDEKLEQAVDKALDSIIRDAPNAKLRDAIPVCALVDKMLLLRGQATSITQNLTIEQKRARVIELLQQRDGVFAAAN